MRWRFLLAAAVLLSALSTGLGCQADASGPTAPSQPAVMLLVDTSGSMNDTDGTKLLKIDGARNALIDFVRAIPPGTKVALRTYPGGTETGLDGCSVGNLQVPLDNTDLSTIDADIRGLTADGDTPTASALQKAAEDLKAANLTGATIVLVSDGLSTCGGDPCLIADQIAASGIDITVNTVGFRISEEGRTQLKCIAGKTKGLYADADNDAELAKQLNELSQPLLDVQLDYPSSVKAAVGADDNGLVTITANITDVGATGVTASQVSLTFTGDVQPVVLGQRRKLGNLAPGQSSQVTFQFRPPFGARRPDVPFTVDARGRNTAPTTKSGTISVDSELSLDDAGPLLKNAKRLAILGDSYSAGEGAGSYESGTNSLVDACHRSRKTYAVPLWDAKASQGYHADVFACSGAISQAIDFTNKDNRTEVAQVGHLRTNDPYDMVLLTMGGNDIGFSWIIKTCVALTSCQKIHNSRLTAALGLVDVLEEDYRSVEGSLNTATNIKARGGKPGALVVLAYPNPMPIQSRLNCSAAFDLGEQPFFQQLVEDLATAEKTAVARLAAEGLPIYFVPDTIDAFQPDHTYCGKEPYINKLKTVKTLGGVAGSLPTEANTLYPSLAVTKAIQDLHATDNAKAALANQVQEQIHPNALGYKAETAELIRWSTTAEARRPVVRTATFLPVITNPSPNVTMTVGRSSGGAVTIGPGQVVQVQGSGLPPGQQTTLTVQSLPASVGQTLADANGNVSFLFRMPRSLAPGRHHLVITADNLDQTSASVTRAIDIRRVRPWWILPLGGAGLMFSTTGAWLWRRSGKPAARKSSER